VRALKFESRLADKIVSRKKARRPWTTIAGLVSIVFLVLTVNSSSLAAPSATIHIGSQSSVARYMGQFDGNSNVMLLGASSLQDWVCVKTPFKGRLADIQSISFSDFIAQNGGGSYEPYIVLKLTEGKYLICHPEYSYADGIWTLPEFTWGHRDTVSNGKWILAPVETRSMIVPLATWVGMIGNREVVSIAAYIGSWDISQPFECFLGNFEVNGELIDIANAKRCMNPNSELPLGF